MKRKQLVFQIDSNKRGKVYVGGKWQKDVVMLDIHGEPFDYEVEIEQYKRDANGRFLVKDDEIERKTKIYRIG